MTVSTPAAANDTLDVHELNERVLTWILSVRSAQDLTAQNIAKHTGLKFWFNPDDSDDFAATGKLVAPWTYTVKSMVSPTRTESAPYPIRFEMGVSGDKNADMTPVCVGLDQYRQALTAAGYESSPLPPHSGVEYWYFNRDKVGIRVHLRGKKKRYDEQLCVFKVVIGAAQ
ncbi:hypothetical protein [Lysobacter sp. CA199]|uniref:hypothetical protein n=1 Tax=Lysobacter sp. CA199 TaxID=3455608 RepID=UPI003F8D33E4